MDREYMIRLCKQGNIGAFEKLYAQSFKKALQTAYLIIGNKTLAEDAVQETFYQCYLDIKGLKNPKAFDAWFHRILVRTCWKVAAKERKKQHELLDENNYSQHFNFSHNQLEDKAQNMEMKVALYDAINNLSEVLRTSVILFYFNEMSIKEIATALGCFESTVKSRLYKARKKIEEELIKKDVIMNIEELNSLKEECV